MVVITPVGWVGLIAAGSVFAVGAAAASISMDHAVKNNAGDIYDDIMSWVGKL